MVPRQFRPGNSLPRREAGGSCPSLRPCAAGNGRQEGVDSFSDKGGFAPKPTVSGPGQGLPEPRCSVRQGFPSRRRIIFRKTACGVNLLARRLTQTLFAGGPVGWGLATEDPSEAGSDVVCGYGAALPAEEPAPRGEKAPAPEERKERPIVSFETLSGRRKKSMAVGGNGLADRRVLAFIRRPALAGMVAAFVLAAALAACSGPGHSAGQGGPHSAAESRGGGGTTVTERRGAADRAETTVWEIYESRKYSVRLRYPSGWARDPRYGERFAGEDGFFQLSAVGGEGLTLDGAAEGEALHKLRPYGSRPQVEKLRVAGRDARLVLPSEDQPEEMGGQAALIVGYPRPGQAPDAGADDFGAHVGRSPLD